MVWRRAWETPLAAGLGLTAHLVLMTFIPADWILTLEPGTTSAAFGAGFSIEQIFAALALMTVAVLVTIPVPITISRAWCCALCSAPFILFMSNSLSPGTATSRKKYAGTRFALPTQVG